MEQTELTKEKTRDLYSPERVNADGEGGVKHSLKITDEKTVERLDNDKHFTTYKSFVQIDGKLYSPMATKVDGKLGNPYELGQWYQAEERPDFDKLYVKEGKNYVVASKRGFNESNIGDTALYYKLQKDDGSTVYARYNPYEHSSNSVFNDQFSSAYKRPGLVTVEMQVPASEQGAYKAKYAKDGTGWTEWKSGKVSTELKKVGRSRDLFLSRYAKPVRVIPDAEVAKMMAKELNGTDITVSERVVPPALYEELKKAGVKTEDIKYSLKDTARDEVKKALADKNYRANVQLTESSPAIMRGQRNVENRPLIIEPSHIRTIILTEDQAKEAGYPTGDDIHYHGFGEKLFFKIIEDLDKINLAYRGTKKANMQGRGENYFFLIAQEKDASGKTIVVPVSILNNKVFVDSKAFIKANKVNTMYGIDNLQEYIRININNGNLVRIKNKSTQVGDGTGSYPAAYGLNASVMDNTTPSAESQEENQKNIRHSFKGETAQGRKDNLDVAKQMAESGIENEKIRLATGWFKGMDGKWRYEINDSGAKLIYKKSIAKYVKDFERQISEAIEARKKYDVHSKEYSFLTSRLPCQRAERDCIPAVLQRDRISQPLLCRADRKHRRLYRCQQRRSRPQVHRSDRELCRPRRSFRWCA